jgi:acetyl-CoA C-acetyltransferase
MEEDAEAVEDGADVQAVREEANRDDPPAVERAGRRRSGRRAQCGLRFLDSDLPLWEQHPRMPLSNYPIVVGVGQITQKSEDPARSLEPSALAAEASRRAEADARKALLRHVDSVRFVSLISWNYGDPAAALAAELGIEPRERAITTMGGNSPQLLINQTADDVAAGKVRLALVAGAEAMYTQRLARAAKVKLAWRPPSGEPDRTIGDNRWGTGDLENRHGAAMPIQIYPLFENALRAARGWTLEEHRARLGRLCARFSAIAAENPHAWFRDPKSAEEIATITPENRIIGFPYPKFMNSILDVDQAAAALVTSVGVARELGIPEDRWIYLRGGAEAHDHWSILERIDFTSSPAIRRAGASALDQAEIGIEDVELLDLYSCFPCAPRIARDMLGIAEDDPRDLTVTGSLLYFGGPGSNHPLHALVTMAEKLRERPGTHGLVSGLGWYVTKHAIGVYSTEAPDRDWRRDVGEIQRAVDADPHPEVAVAADGPATVETYTVMHDREGAPALGIVIGRLDDGRRFIANTPADRALLEDMERREVIGVAGRVASGGDEGVNRWQPR